ncbi:MAG TPA: two-component sensor histidine kinase [Cyanobacteria bacterium UBA8553]|nr:two-component sensor histidine kinase [Cyanobacteria bacterium UBA8553]
MAKPGQSSFRRILLSRLLLLSVPVLLAGVYVTYRKARTTLLETARQNLTESAVRKGENIQQSIDALKASLVNASQAVVLQSKSKAASQRFINQLTQELPTQIQCVQLSDIKTKALVASTCGNQAIALQKTTVWPAQKNQLLFNRDAVLVTTRLPQPSQSAVTPNTDRANSTHQLNLVLSAPVYNSVGQLQYALSIQSAILKQYRTQPRSLFGYPVVINQKGTILAHIDPQRVGQNIDREGDAGALQEIVSKASAGGQGSRHLFSFEKKGVELVAGYTSIPSPITAERNQKWTIFAITPSNNALDGLKDIQQVLFILTCCLIAACFLATVYVARDLARPLEKLRDYALNQSKLHCTDRVPHDFKIREFNQLSEALDGMIERLRDWAEELEAAWQEAQTANQLKNEFLANTSHELRTPLNGIIGCLRLVRDGFCDDREEELDFLQRADDAAIHLLGIINDVLDIAKIEAGKLSVEIEPTDMRKLLNEVINLQAVPIQHKGIEFHTSELHDVIAVNADPAKLKQVLLNVVGNAVKFTDSGSIMIQTRMESASDLKSSTDDSNKGSASGGPAVSNGSVPGSSFVVVTVKDTGIGIDPSQQHKLFRPFVMVDGSTTRKCGGTGLGLAISRNLIELMGGSIALFSDGEGKGTTVEITLPTIEPCLLLSGESNVN